MKVVGVDPGLAATGVGVVSGRGMKVNSFAFGSIYTAKEGDLPRRLDRIFSKLRAVLEDEKPDLMVVEDIFSLDKYPKSGITLGKVTGVILLAGHQSGLSVREIPVREAKQVLTGNGNAGKDQLEKAVRHMLKSPVPIRPYHASDALAMALIGVFRFSRC
jgi:crossover junction endodeoxyribonuclease RuvC